MVIDTNVLLYAVDSLSEFNSGCARFIERRRTDSPTFLPLGVCYEFLRVCTHPRFSGNYRTIAEASAFIGELLSLPNHSILMPTDRRFAVLCQTLDEIPELRSNIMHDVHTAVLMRENGIREICTRDTDFYRFPFITVVDPLRQ